MRIRELKAAILQRLYDVYREQGADSGIVVDEELEAEMGTRPGDVAQVVRDLERRGLVEFEDEMTARLTAVGVEEIEEPGSDANKLINISHVAISGGNIQFGNHNTQNITVHAVLTSLVEAIEKAPDISNEKKAQWKATVGQILAHPLTQTTISVLTGIVSK